MLPNGSLEQTRLHLMFAIPLMRVQFGQSEEPEVRGIWPEVGRKLLYILLIV